MLRQHGRLDERRPPLSAVSAAGGLEGSSLGVDVRALAQQKFYGLGRREPRREVEQRPLTRAQARDRTCRRQHV